MWRRVPEKLRWVDGFVRRIRPHVTVRILDNVVIRMPNQAFRVNATGARVLARLLGGAGMRRLLGEMHVGEGDPRIGELNRFLEDLAVVLGDRYCENYRSEAIERVEFRLGYIELPVLSEIALTGRCNLRCRFCYGACAHTSERTGPEERLSTVDMERILRKVRGDAGVPSVSFTGGEPVLREDLVQLIAYAHKTLNMRVNLITNGTLIDRVLARRMKRAGLVSAQVSIEGPDVALHDAITGVGGSFDASCRGLRNLVEAGIWAHPHTTICGMNAGRVDEMAGFAKGLGIERFSANLVIPAGRGVDPELDVLYTEIGGILGRVREAAAAERVRFMWYSPTPVCLYNPVAQGMGNRGCSACEGLLSIDPMGNVLPCSSWPEPLGNLLTGEFREIWYSERSRLIRGKGLAWSGCRECESLAVCHGACPLYFGVHGHHEISGGVGVISGPGDIGTREET